MYSEFQGLLLCIPTYIADRTHEKVFVSKALSVIRSCCGLLITLCFVLHLSPSCPINVFCQQAGLFVMFLMFVMHPGRRSAAQRTRATWAGATREPWSRTGGASQPQTLALTMPPALQLPCRSPSSAPPTTVAQSRCESSHMFSNLSCLGGSARLH
jgi:hypothetical protein